MKDTPKGCGLASNPGGKRRRGCVGHHAERHDHRGIAGTRGDGRAVRAREQDRVQAVGLHHLVDAVRAGQQDVLGAIGLVAARGRPARPSRRKYRAATGRSESRRPTVWVMFHSRSSVSDFTGAEAPSVASQALKSRFMPYFRTTEQSLSLPLALFTPEHWPHSAKFCAGILGDDAGDVGRVHDLGALLLEDLDGLGHDARLLRREAVAEAPAAAPSAATAARRAGKVDVVVVVRARDADARALQSVRSEKARVVAAGRRSAGLGRGVVRVGRGALQRAQHDGGIGDGLRHGPGGVLVRGDGDHAVAADAADRGLDGGQHVLVRRAEDRARGFACPRWPAQKFAAVPTPELEPPVRERGAAVELSSRADRGAGRRD